MLALIDEALDHNDRKSFDTYTAQLQELKRKNNRTARVSPGGFYA
ncbi:IDEAL domain-containing protein [Planococcus sp. MB-3u-03]